MADFVMPLSYGQRILVARLSAMKVAFLLYDRLTALDLIGPYEVLQGMPDVEVQFVAREAGPVTVDSGAFSIVAPYSFADVPSADVLVVPGSSCGTLAAMADPQLIDWVLRIDESTRFTTSVCSGALILARAGLLKGKPATTHWAALPYLRRLGAEPRPEQRIVQSGKFVTAAGVSAGIDMALFLVGELAGRAQAEATQLMIEYDPKPPFDSGHTSKASPKVRAQAERDMKRMSITASECLAVLRLAGQSFVSHGKKTLRFSL
jgi:transcriptional regulator GlxA family with amidase domain